MTPFSFQSRGTTVEAWRFGEGRRVLAAHGWLDNANTWKPIAEASQGIEWVSIDFPGHGRSGHAPPGETYHFVDNVEVLLDAADALGWKKFSLVGHSMGGSMALMFAAAFPERVQSLVLSDSFGPLTGEESEAAQQLRLAILSRRRGRSAEPHYYPERNELSARMLKGNPALNLKAAETLLERSAVFVRDQGWGFSYDRRARDVSPYRFTAAQVDAFLANVECPTLMLRAKDGGIMRSGSLEDRLDLVKDLKVVDVAGNHHVHLMRPSVIGPLIEAFLKGEKVDENVKRAARETPEDTPDEPVKETADEAPNETSDEAANEAPDEAPDAD